MKMSAKILDVPIWQWIFLVLIVVLVGTSYQPDGGLDDRASETDSSDLAQIVLPEEGVTLPIVWGDIGRQLVDSGAIDAEKFEKIYEARGGLSEAERELLYGEENGSLEINRENAHVVLNLLWAFGLANKNPVLEEGPMQNPEYGGAQGFASTGGFSLTKTQAMDHYSKHSFVTLSAEQQALVEKVSKGTYRPCCNNSTYFPDCNHGMAMLGFLELMASEGASEEEMYEAALVLNSYWFPSTYLTIGSYFANQGVSWSEVDPQEVLGFNYSSASGFRDVLAKTEPIDISGGGSCGV